MSNSDPWMANADDARVLRQDDAHGPIGKHRDYPESDAAWAARVTAMQSNSRWGVQALKMAINAEESVRAAYRGGVLDETGWHPLNRCNPVSNGGQMVDVNSMYPAVLTSAEAAAFDVDVADCTRGHAAYTIAGELQGDCLRCGVWL